MRGIKLTEGGNLISEEKTLENIRFVVKLADTPIEARVLHESTRQFLREYLTEEAAAFFFWGKEEKIS